MANVAKISQQFRTVVVNNVAYLHHEDVTSMLFKARFVQTDPESIANFNALEAMINDAAREAVNPLA